MTLHIFSPLGHSAKKLQGLFQDAGMRAERRADTGALVAGVEAEAWRAAMDDVAAGLSRVEREAIRVIVARPGVEPTLADVAGLVTLEQFIGRWRCDWLMTAVEAEALSVDFAPVAYADAPAEVFAHAAQLGARAPDGRALRAGELFDLARDADFLAALDRAGRLASIRAAARVGVDTPIFVSFSPSAIYDPRFCLRTTLAEADRTGVARENIVFSILPTDTGADIDHLDDVLRYYVDNGFRTALTMSPERQGSFEILQRLKPSVLILDAALTEGVRRDQHREVIARKVLEIAQRLQIETLVQGVDDDEACDWAYSHGASFVQGGHVAAAAARSVA
jgi:EAL domain-containing protein (putative c-di-GMP-specific phosphodiesterase class I)